MRDRRAPSPGTVFRSAAGERVGTTLAVASAAIPSPCPTNPIPSAVVNFTFTSAGAQVGRLRQPLAHRVPERVEPRLLADHHGVHVHRHEPLLGRPARARAAAARCCRRRASARRCPGSGCRCPRGPRRRAAHRSPRAPARRRPSGRPAPSAHGTSTPPSTSLRPSSKRCESKPMPERALIRAAPGGGCAPRRPPAR